MAVVLAALAAPAAAQAGGTPGPSVEGGAQYGAPLVRARPARPVARYFRVGPGYVVAPAPAQARAAHRRGGRQHGQGAHRLHAPDRDRLDRAHRPRPDPGRPARGRDVAGRHGARARALPRAPARARAARHRPRAQGQHAGPRRRSPCARPRRRPRRCPTPPGHVFPVSGPHTYGDGVRRAAQRLLAPGPGRARRRGPARRRARRRARSPSPTTRRRPPATTSSRRAPTATTTSSPTARRARRRGGARRRSSRPASRSATSARRATRRGRICTSRLGRADGGSMRAHTPSTRCRCCRAGTSAQRQPQLAGDAGELGPRPGGHIADAGADELRDLGGQEARTQAGGERAGGTGG